MATTWSQLFEMGFLWYHREREGIAARQQDIGRAGVDFGERLVVGTICVGEGVGCDAIRKADGIGGKGRQAAGLADSHGHLVQGHMVLIVERGIIVKRSRN